MSEFYNDAAFQCAASGATRCANQTGERQRIFRQYNTYCIRPATHGYEGIHIAFIEPDAELIRIRPA